MRKKKWQNENKPNDTLDDFAREKKNIRKQKQTKPVVGFVQPICLLVETGDYF